MADTCNQEIASKVNGEGTVATGVYDSANGKYVPVRPILKPAAQTTNPKPFSGGK